MTWRFADRPLASAGKAYFGSWKAALTAAGLASEYREPKPTTRWRSQRVLDAILHHHDQGTPIAKIWKVDVTLYSMAKKHFGSWREAVSAAGLKVEQKCWSRQTIIDEIHSASQQGLSLSSRSPHNRLVVSAANRYFGSWRKALRAAKRQSENKVARKTA